MCETNQSLSQCFPAYHKHFNWFSWLLIQAHKIFKLLNGYLFHLHLPITYWQISRQCCFLSAALLLVFHFPHVLRLPTNEKLFHSFTELRRRKLLEAENDQLARLQLKSNLQGVKWVLFPIHILTVHIVFHLMGHRKTDVLRELWRKMRKIGKTEATISCFVAIDSVRCDITLSPGNWNARGVFRKSCRVIIEILQRFFFGLSYTLPVVTSFQWLLWELTSKFRQVFTDSSETIYSVRWATPVA